MKSIPQDVHLAPATDFPPVRLRQEAHWTAGRPLPDFWGNSAPQLRQPEIEDFFKMGLKIEYLCIDFAVFRFADFHGKLQSGLGPAICRDLTHPPLNIYATDA